MNKMIMTAFLISVLAGCQALEKLDGAYDGVSFVGDRIEARCARLDGEVVRVAIDDLASEIGSDDEIERARIARQRACNLVRLGLFASDAILRD